jgi:CubicO group peptidase (beta-lactamase class C family)
MPGAIWHQYAERIGMMWQRERGEVRLLDWHDQQHCTACSPGGNSRGPVRELARFYECLLAGGTLDGARLLHAETVAEMTRPQRVGQFDLTLQHVMNFGLGFMLDSKRYGSTTVPYGFGSGCSEAAFGHGGSQSSLAFADPEHGLVVAYVANNRPGEPHHQRRHREIVEAIWGDIGDIET